MEYDVHTLLDLLTLGATGWVIFMILTKLKSTWQQDKDVMLEAYVVRSPLLLPTQSPDHLIFKDCSFR